MQPIPHHLDVPVIPRPTQLVPLHLPQSPLLLGCSTDTQIEIYLSILNSDPKPAFKQDLLQHTVNLTTLLTNPLRHPVTQTHKH